jgi:hypothetical protein
MQTVLVGVEIRKCGINHAKNSSHMDFNNWLLASFESYRVEKDAS